MTQRHNGEYDDLLEKEIPMWFKAAHAAYGVEA
jgi:hypothetical protein